MPEALIIGGGPAGSMAAILLARSGWHVILVEQHHLPRNKVCGECLSALGCSVLRRAGVWGAIRAGGAVELSKAVVYAQDGRHTTLNLPASIWGFSRRALDPLLLNVAARAGALVRQGVRCERIRGGCPPMAVLHDLRTNRIEERTAPWVMVADGKSALLDAADQPSDLGVKTHFRGISAPRDRVELFSLAGHYAGLAPVEDGTWNLAMSIPRAKLRACPDLDELLRRLMGENRALGEQLASATRAGRWLACPLPRFGVRGNWPAGVIPLGNAAAAIEPIGGEGMGLALRSAELAADALVDGSVAALGERFAQLWRARSDGCRWAARAASQRHLAMGAVSLLTAAPSLARRPLEWMGK